MHGKERDDRKLVRRRLAAILTVAAQLNHQRSAAGKSQIATLAFIDEDWLGAIIHFGAPWLSNYLNNAVRAAMAFVVLSPSYAESII